MRTLTKYVLSTFGGKVITRAEMEKSCEKFGRDVRATVNFMISYGYLVRILRGLYYVKTVEEFKLKKALDIYRILSLGMEKLKVKWYFGLYTALTLNGLTHEHFDVIFVVNDSIFRPKEIKVAGERVKFLKLKMGLFGFGVVEKGVIKFSDPEKTLLDFVYISRYRSLPKERIESMVEEYSGRLDPSRIKAYLRFYPKTVEEVIKNARVI